MKSFGARILDLALCVTAAVLLLTWAWDKLQPLLPALFTIALAGILVSVVVRRHRGW